MKSLTARQTQILKTIVEEFTDTALPVGSGVLEKKHNLGVSSATIRAEMSNLTSMGYLNQPHTSAGRTPTSAAMKFYVNQLMEEKQMSLTDEVKAKEEVWDVREDIDDLMEEATQALATRTNSLAVAAIINNEKIWHAGYSNLFDDFGLVDIRVCARILTLIEQSDLVQKLLFEKGREGKVEIIFGDDMGWGDLAGMSAVVKHFNLAGKNAAIAVMGPMRRKYPTIVPITRYFGSLIEEIYG